MNSALRIILIGIFAIIISCTYNKSMEHNSIETVKYVDIEKYAGKWYEIAKIPNKFQKKCAKNTTAFYEIIENKKISVVNSCVTSNNEIIKATGIAKVIDDKTNAKLKVSFVKILGINLFWGDYWIIGLDKDYRFAVIGTPNRKYGWILGRTPKLEEKDLDTIKEVLKKNGYNFDDFEFTPQD